MTEKTLGAIGSFYQLGQTLIGGYYQRKSTRLAARSITFQNSVNQRQMAVQNRVAQSQYLAARAQAGLMRAQAAAENTARDANNLQSRAMAGLDNWARTVANNRTLKAGGAEYEAAVTNQLRTREAVVGAGIEARIAAAETQGALAAAIALSGGSGSSMDALAQTTALRDQRQEFYQTRQSGYADYDAMQQIIGIIPQAAASLDMSVTQPNQDYGVSIGPADPMAPVPGAVFNQQVPQAWGNVGTDAMSWFMNKDNDAAARQLFGAVTSWFDKPKTP
jgi:hypothetical protein